MQRKGRQRKPQKPPPPGIGYFHTLPRQEQEALVEWARQSTREQRKVDEAHNAEVAISVTPLPQTLATAMVTSGNAQGQISQLNESKNPNEDAAVGILAV